MGICETLWEGSEKNGYRCGDVVYANSRIDALFGLIGISAVLTDLERCGFRPILRLLKAESAFVELGDQIGMLYKDLSDPVYKAPDAIADDEGSVEELRDKWIKGEV
jgi:hypothetical protein